MTLQVQNNNDFSNQLEQFEKIQDVCAKLLKSKHYAALGEAGIHAVMARAKALGIDPFEALNGGFHCINGKVGMSTEMMAALVRQRGHSIKKDPKSTNEIVILHGTRADNGDTWTCSFSKEDAMAAGLWGSATWKKYPGVMLYNRCMSMLFRQLFPDLSLGAGYVEDELKEITRTGDYANKPPVTLELQVDEVKEEKPVVEPVTPLQAEELRILFALANDEAIKNVSSILKVRGLDGFKNLPSTGYAYIKKILEENPRKKEEPLIWESQEGGEA